MRTENLLIRPSYSVNTLVYSGPLDLLLQLIERAELDITHLALAEVTDQYLVHLRNLPDSSAEEVSAFLTIAAKLLQIKSEMLLPRPPIREQGEEDPGEALAKQLQIYKRFKQVSELLAFRETAGLQTFPRQAPYPKLEGNFALEGLRLDDIVNTASLVFSRIDIPVTLSSVVALPKITIREKISAIANFLRTNSRGNFNQLVNRKAIRLEIVVTFLALLELVKLHLINAYQGYIFGEIEFESTENWDNETSFELEFGE